MKIQTLRKCRRLYDREPGSIEITTTPGGEHVFAWKGGRCAFVSDELTPEFAAYVRDEVLPWEITWGPRDPHKRGVYIFRGAGRWPEDPTLKGGL